MKHKKITYILAIFVAYLTNLAGVFVSWFGFLDPRIRKFLNCRRVEPKTLSAIQVARAKKDFCVIFFCSSAGEYEQALPLARRLFEEHNTYVHIFFFSPSGSSFAKLRNESIPFSLAPVDTFQNWQKIFKVLKPNMTIIVRHELWPCFLYSANKFGPTYLVNASLRSDKSIFIKKMLFEFIDKIFTVSEGENANFLNYFSELSSKLKTLGDSKYDRVLERVNLINSKNELSQLTNSKQKLRLIVGSAWERDCELALKSLAIYKTVQQVPLQIILVPHQPKPKFVESLKQECEKYKLTWQILKNLNEQVAADVLIVDKVGILFDLYGECDLAFVGGALHHQVHNVLEPAAFGLPLAFGPLYQNSHEACDLVKERLARVVQNSDEFIEWVVEVVTRGVRDLSLRSYIESKAGACSRLLAEIEVYKKQVQKKRAQKI